MTDPAHVWDAVKWLYGEDPEWVRAECRKYLKEKAAKARAPAAAGREPGSDDA